MNDTLKHPNLDIISNQERMRKNKMPTTLLQEVINNRESQITMKCINSYSGIKREIILSNQTKIIRFTPTEFKKNDKFPRNQIATKLENWVLKS